jgi:hypothetical protein
LCLFLQKEKIKVRNQKDNKEIGIAFQKHWRIVTNLTETGKRKGRITNEQLFNFLQSKNYNKIASSQEDEEDHRNVSKTRKKVTF